ncbi:MAG: L-threonylcarbamoyladenylate synthase [Rhizobiaceae bacterium]
MARALAELRAARCVAIPTETVYGLAGDATSGEAVARIFEMKGRPRFNPLICHVSGLEMARRIGVFSDPALALAKRFWPGPLTLVVPLQADAGIHDLVTADLDSVAIRQPAGASCAIIGSLGRPLAAPSANRSGRISPTTAAHVAKEFPGESLLVLDGGSAEVGLESTIAKVEDTRIVLLRPGAITVEELTQASGLPVELAQSGGPVQAPGMLASHYAPDAPVRLDVFACPAGASLLAFGDETEKDRREAVRSVNLSERGDLREAAANLYRMLKMLDEHGARLICVEPIPEKGLGMAINDRLRRAAAPRD